MTRKILTTSRPSLVYNCIFIPSAKIYDKLCSWIAFQLSEKSLLSLSIWSSDDLLVFQMQCLIDGRYLSALCFTVCGGGVLLVWIFFNFAKVYSCTFRLNFVQFSLVLN